VEKSIIPLESQRSITVHARAIALACDSGHASVCVLLRSPIFKFIRHSGTVEIIQRIIIQRAHTHTHTSARVLMIIMSHEICVSTTVYNQK